MPDPVTDLRIPEKLDAAGDWLLGLRMLSNVATTSLAVSGWPLLNFSPGRSVNVHDSLSADSFHEAASCGLSCPLPVVLTSWAEARPTANIVSYWVVVSGLMPPVGVISPML